MFSLQISWKWIGLMHGESPGIYRNNFQAEAFIVKISFSLYLCFLVELSLVVPFFCYKISCTIGYCSVAALVPTSSLPFSTYRTRQELLLFNRIISVRYWI